MPSNKEKLEEAVNQSLHELKEDYHPEHGYQGWHQFFNSPKIGIVATSQAVLLLHKFQDSFGVTDSVKFIVSKQKLENTPAQLGGWGYITNASNIANTESTCWALEALKLYLPETNQTVVNGLGWLDKNFRAHGENCGWGSVYDGEMRIYPTCRALEVLKIYNLDKGSNCRKAVATLKRIQNSDGGWGEKPGGRSTVSHTSYVVNILIDYGTSITSSSVAKGATWLKNVISAEAFRTESLMGYVELIDFVYLINGKNEDQRITFYHMPLPYAIRALIKAQQVGKEMIYDVVSRLINEHVDGHWVHPFLPAKKTVWSMYDVLSLFYEFKTSDLYDRFDDYAYRAPTLEKPHYDAIIFTIVPVELITLHKILGLKDIAKADHIVKGLWYYEVEIIQESKKTLKCLLTMVGGAGEVSCSVASQTTFEHFNCDLAILCGIAAGNKEEIVKYSSLIADNIVAYEYQRIETTSITFRPKFYKPSVEITRAVEKMPLLEAKVSELATDFFGKTRLEYSTYEEFVAEKIKHKIGSIASGAKLLADGKTLQVLRESIPIAKGIVAAEMEGGGFAPACEEQTKDWLVVRGISDYGEDDKDNKQNKEFQGLAVASAAAAMVTFLKFCYKKKNKL